MKRIGAVLALMAILITAFSSCSKEQYTMATLYDHMVKKTGCSYAGASIYDSRGMLGKRAEEEFLAALFKREGYPTEFDDLADYLLILSGKDDGFEIDVFRVKHLSEAHKIEQMLLERKKLVSSPAVQKYLGEKYDDYLASCRIYTKGCYLFFLATGENDRYIGLINDII